MLYHRTQHLCSHYHRLTLLDALIDKVFLYARNLSVRNFNGQIATDYHNIISYFQYFIDIVDPFLVFNFCNNLDRTVMLIKNTLNGQNDFFIP